MGAQAFMKLRQRRHGAWKWAEWLRRQLSWPLGQLIRLAHWRLSKLMLLALEVALEHMLALLHSPQVLGPQPCSIVLRGADASTPAHMQDAIVSCPCAPA